METKADNIELQNEERIDRYLFSKMTEEEERAFEQELQVNETLRKQAESSARMVQAMSVIGKRKDKEYIAKGKNNRLIKPRIWHSVAACVVAVLMVGGGYFYYDYRHTTGLGHEYVTTFPDGGLIRGEENSATESELNELFRKVAMAEDLSSTITQLTRLWQASRSETYNQYTSYSSLIGWNLALAYLQDYDKAEAKRTLDELEKECPEGTAIGDMVRELKARL